MTRILSLTLLLAPWHLPAATLGEYLHLALENNPDLQAMEARYEAAAARIPQLTALPDPMFEVRFFDDSPMRRQGVSEVMLTQSFPWFGKLQRAGEASGAEAEAMLFAVQAAQLDLSSQVGDLYYELAYLAKAAEVTQANLMLLRRLESIAEQMTASGGALNDFLRLQVEVGMLEDELSGLREALQGQEARLQALLGGQMPPNALPEMEASVADVPSPPDRLLPQMLDQHPRILGAERQEASAEARLAVAQLEGRPEFMAGLIYMPDRSRSGMEGADDWGLRVGFSVPLWRQKYRAAEREARAGRREAEAALSQVRNELRAEFFVALSELRDAHRRLLLYRERLLPVARQALANTEESYRAGGATVLDLIDSERSVLAFDLAYWQAVADSHRARLRLSLLTGQPLQTFTDQDSQS